MAFKFEKLEIWNLALDFANDVHQLTHLFPKEELYGLSSQFKRAADSISLNIVEGSIGQSNAEQQKFISYAIRSSAECVTCLHLCLRRNYIDEKLFNAYYKRLELVFTKMIAFKRNIK